MMISFVGFAFLCRGADKYFVVKITNFAKQSEYKVLNEEELKNLQKEIADETRLWSKVITAAQKEWQSNEQYKGKSFPTGAIDKRTVKVIGQPYTDQSKAEDKISSIEEQEQEKAEKEAEREKEKAAKLGTKAKDKEKDKGKDAERENMYAMARAMFEQKLNELMEAERKPKEEQKATPAPAEK